MEEIWKDIPDYNGYQVSNLGRVRTYNKVTYTERHGTRGWRNRILKFKGQTYKTGYRVDLWKDGKPHTMLVARLVAFTFYNEDINNHELTVDHIDGNRFNNNLENLELVSLAENIRRGFKNGLYTTQTGVKVYDKKSKKVKEFMSLSKASVAIGKSNCYLSGKIKQNKFENEEYKWEIVK
jgi:hypothetical protein